MCVYMCVWVGMDTAFKRVCAFEVACMNVCVCVSQGGHGDTRASLRVAVLLDVKLFSHS